MKGSSWRGLAALLVVSALAVAAQTMLVEQLLAPWRLVTETLEPDFRVVAISTRVMGSEPMIELVVEPARVIIIGTRALVPDTAAPEFAKSTMPRGAVWLLLTAYLVTLVAWPVQRPAHEWPARLLLGLPVLALLLALDAPITLLGPLRALLVGNSSGEWDVWIAGSRFLRGGGRYLLAVVAAAGLCLAIQSTLRPKRLT